jgi:hypothetical protein
MQDILSADQQVRDQGVRQTGGTPGVDLIRESVRLVMQDLVEVDAAEQIGAGRYERAEGRTTHRNGSRPKVISTQAGDVELAIPKLRQGSFFPVILERRRRIDQALYAVVMEAWVNGVSTPRGRRPRGRTRDRVGHLQVGGVEDLGRPGRAGVSDRLCKQGSRRRVCR